MIIADSRIRYWGGEDGGLTWKSEKVEVKEGWEWG